MSETETTLTVLSSAKVTRKGKTSVPLKSFPELAILAQSSAECPGCKATFPLLPFVFCMIVSPPLPPAAADPVAIAVPALPPG